MLISKMMIVSLDSYAGLMQIGTSQTSPGSTLTQRYMDLASHLTTQLIFLKVSRL